MLRRHLGNRPLLLKTAPAVLYEQVDCVSSSPKLPRSLATLLHAPVSHSDVPVNGALKYDRLRRVLLIDPRFKIFVGKIPRSELRPVHRPGFGTVTGADQYFGSGQFIGHGGEVRWELMAKIAVLLVALAITFWIATEAVLAAGSIGALR